VRLPGRVIGLAGDLTRAEAEAAAADLLPPVTPLLPGERLDPDVRPLSAGGGSEVVERLPRLTQVTLSLVRDSPGITDPDYPAFLIADHVLGGHFYSRLSVALRHRSGQTYGAGTRWRREAIPMVYALSTFTRTVNAGVAEDTMRDVLARFHEAGIDEEERVAAAGYLLGRLPFARQSPGGILDRALAERRLGLPAGTFDGVVERAGQTSREEVDAFIRRFFVPQRFAVVRVGPAGRAPW
jgi:zinc protease